jgi:hypothetical protein
MDLVIVQSTNALLESQKTLVDFCSLNPAMKQMIQEIAVIGQFPQQRNNSPTEATSS